MLGSRVRRVDGAEKVSGLERFAADPRLPGTLHGRLLLSPHAHARVASIAADEATRLPGVVAVVTLADLAHLLTGEVSSRARSLLADERVRFRGQPVAVVLAESEAVAEDALALVEVEYEPLPAVVDPIVAMQPGSPVVWEDGLPGESAEAAMHATIEADGQSSPRLPNVASTVQHDRGDVERGFAEADLILERTYRTSMVHQGYLEPHASIAMPDPLGKVTVWTGTQALFYCRAEVAEMLGLPEAKVKIVPLAVGGGFGGKQVLLEPLAAALALLTGRPISLVYTRMDEFLSSTPAPQSVIELKLGAKRDGRLTALEARIIFDAGLFPGGPAGIAASVVGGYYRLPNLRIRGFVVVTHKTPQGAYRAPGAVQGTFAIESLMDDLARELMLDPIELRLRSCVEGGDPLPNGTAWPRIGFRACLERLRDHPLWRARNDRQRPAHDGVLEGVGVAAGGWLGGLQPASAICRLESDGTLSVVLGTVDIAGTSTGLAMIAAETLGVAPERARIIAADSDTAPFSAGSSGSKITLAVGAAVLRASQDARDQILAIAADQLEASPADLELRDGTVRVRGAPGRSTTLARVAGASTAFGSRYEPVLGRGASAISQHAPGFGAHLARVRVDPETGAVDVVQYVVVQDVGRAINRAGIEDQIMGGVVQGIGWSLYEQMVYDEHGELVTASLMDYALPSARTSPLAIEPLIVEVPSESGPYGVRGVGEPPVIPVPAAMANAIRDATGARLTELPMRSERIVAALGNRSG